ncbi:hypothetical protein FOA52_011911 [Chlamydomonas sp. UWO 241]|nr:hypothetical protein FOA52_011911 [Chlamydomonas sp. UWO 241]
MLVFFSPSYALPEVIQTASRGIGYVKNVLNEHHKGKVMVLTTCDVAGLILPNDQSVWSNPSDEWKARALTGQRRMGRHSMTDEFDETKARIMEISPHTFSNEKQRFTYRGEGSIFIDTPILDTRPIDDVIELCKTSAGGLLQDVREVPIKFDDGFTTEKFKECIDMAEKDPSADSALVANMRSELNVVDAVKFECFNDQRSFSRTPSTAVTKIWWFYASQRVVALVPRVDADLSKAEFWFTIVNGPAIVKKALRAAKEAVGDVGAGTSGAGDGDGPSSSA